MKRTPIFCLFIFLLTSNCESPGNGNLGPCVHFYEDPILLIESISDAESGDSISQTNIFDVYIDSVKQNLSSLIRDSSQNVSIEDSVISCQTPCGFGTHDGHYQFTVNTTSYETKTQSIKNVDYNEFEGGCPSRSYGSTTLQFELQPK
jgi:hypothetical protein